MWSTSSSSNAVSITVLVRNFNRPCGPVRSVPSSRAPAHQAAHHLLVGRRQRRIRRWRQDRQLITGERRPHLRGGLPLGGSTATSLSFIMPFPPNRGGRPTYPVPAIAPSFSPAVDTGAADGGQPFVGLGPGGCRVAQL